MIDLYRRLKERAKNIEKMIQNTPDAYEEKLSYELGYLAALKQLIEEMEQD